jgi:hypothetical protein
MSLRRSWVADRGYANLPEGGLGELRRIPFHELRRCRNELHTRRGRKRNITIYGASRVFDTPLTMPLKNPWFLCRSRPRYSLLLKAAMNALVADELPVDGPGT